MKLIEALDWRYAVKKFSADKISDSELAQLLDATRLSASSYGLQPYKIIVVESKAIREQLLSYSYGQNKILYSSHLIIFAVPTLIGETTVDRYIDKYAQITGVPVCELSDYANQMKSVLLAMSLEQKQEWANQQAYIALGNLLTCAAVMRIDNCPMTGFNQFGYDRVLGLDKRGLTASVICPIGRRHEDDLEALRPKVRFDYDDIVMEI